MKAVFKADILKRRRRPDTTLQLHEGRTRKARRSVLKGVSCPRCQSDAIYRYGKTANGKKRYLCQVCRRQFSLKSPGRLNSAERPSCPSCGKPMHVYMLTEALIRFRCAAYPTCKTFFKRKRETR